MAAAPLLEAEPEHEPSGTLPEAELGGEGMPVDAGSTLGTTTAVAESASEPVELVERRDAGRGARWRFSPHLQLSATYDDNIFIQALDAQDDLIFGAAAGVAVGYWDGEEERERFLDRNHVSTVFERSRGNLLLLDYTAIAQKFLHHKSEDSLDHDGVFEARWHQEKLTLAASAHLESKTETNIDIGQRLRRKTATSSVSARFAMTEITTIGIEGANIVNDPENFIGNVETRGAFFVEYAATPLTTIGISAAVGAVDPDLGSDQTYERVTGRADYLLSDKVAASMRGGAEFRQFDESGEDRVDPIFELRTTWLPAADTEVAVEAFRRVETSAALVEENFTVTGFDVSFRRAIRSGLHLSIAGGYQHVEYTTAGDESSRRDNYFFVRPALFYSFANWGNASISYEHREDDSDRAASNFSQNLTTVQVGVQY